MMRPMSNSAVIEQLVRTGEGRIHLVGISGFGMAGLACLLQKRGFDVSGCDIQPGIMGEWLNGVGINPVVGHSPDHLDDHVDWMIRSAAVPETASEIAAALEKGIPVFRRGEVLPALLMGAHSVAVAGTHGKTSVSSFIAQMLTKLGRAPSFCIGGETRNLGGVAGHGGTDATMVVEADESDGTVALYVPDIAVLTNIEYDHMEQFSSASEFRECFASLIANTKQRVVYCVDDPGAASLCRDSSKALSYGFSESAVVRGAVIEEDGESVSFDVSIEGSEEERITLAIPGRHNVLNVLAAIAVGYELGIDLASMVPVLGALELPDRRFDVVVNAGGVRVISDYAHHPTEIRALISTAVQGMTGRLLAVFQPHRYTRTKALGCDFPVSFKGVDQLVLLPVYSASEEPIQGGTVWDLYSHFRDGIEGSGIDCYLSSSLEQAWDYFREELEEGDTLLVVGAGDVERIAGWAGAEIADCKSRMNCLKSDRVKALTTQQFSNATTISFNEPMARRTTFGLGGTADAWVEIANEDDLALIIRWCEQHRIPFNLVGAGSNLLVSDLGLRGVTVRLSMEGFCGIREKDGLVVAGAGARIRKLMESLEVQGKRGLEFLEGIPGTVGGAVRMNAGAWGGEIGTAVKWVRGIDMHGRTRTLEAGALDFSYRACPALRDLVVLEVGFSLLAGDCDSIAGLRSEYAVRRDWMRGLRCAGSVFRNPEGRSAGQLIDELDLKGKAVGGARISEQHANVIDVGKDATASDVMCLIELTRRAVKDERGIDLEEEIVIL